MKAGRSLVGLAAVICAVSSAVDSARAAERLDPTGTWTWVRELEGKQAQSVLTLSYKDGKLSGSYKRQGQVVPISKAKFDKNEISFDADREMERPEGARQVQGKAEPR